MKCEVLIGHLWHSGARPKKGDVIEMAAADAVKSAAAGHVRILPDEAATTGDAGGDGGDGQESKTGKGRKK